MALIVAAFAVLMTGFDQLAELVPDIGPAAEAEHVSTEGDLIVQQRGEHAEILCYWSGDVAPSCTDGWQHWALLPEGVRKWSGSSATPPKLPTPAEATPPIGVPAGPWDALAACEARGNWAINTGNSYFGGLQENMANWVKYGGLAYAPRPDLAPRSAQIAVAGKILSEQGWRAWPACSRSLGLR